MDSFGMCGCPDAVLFAAEAQVAKWGKSTVTWTMSGLLPGYTRERLQERYAAALQQWMDVCGITLTYRDGAADVTMGSGHIDGPNGTLAWSELPNGSDRPLKQRYDTGERWDDVMVLAVACHEWGHALGVGHLSGGNLMQPFFSRSITKPQPGDIAELVRRYGPARPRPTEPTPTGEVVIEIAGSSPRLTATGDNALSLAIPRTPGLKIRIPGYKVTPE